MHQRELTACPYLPRSSHPQAQQAQTEWAVAATAAELERERGRTAELLHEQEALHKMSAYQEEAVQLLGFAALAAQLEGELTLYPTGTASTAAAAAGPVGGLPAVAGSRGGPNSTQTALAAATAAPACINPAAVAAMLSGSGGNPFGCSSLAQGAVAAAAAAPSDALDLDAALAELDDADLALLVHQVQGGSGEDWMDGLQWLEEPLPVQRPPQAAQPQAAQPPLQPVQRPAPQQQPISKQRQQEEAEDALVRELTQEPPVAVFWDQYPLQPPSWLLRCA